MAETSILRINSIVSDGDPAKYFLCSSESRHLITGITSETVWHVRLPDQPELIFFQQQGGDTENMKTKKIECVECGKIVEVPASQRLQDADWCRGCRGWKFRLFTPEREKQRRESEKFWASLRAEEQ